jgi:hypothetical protein
MRDKWGLPRRWRFWRDPLFWFYTLWILLTGFPIWLLANDIVVGTLFTYRGLVVLTPVLVLYASIYWVIYDTYRWEHPDRWLWFFLALFWWVLGFPYYLIKRREWFQELSARRNKPI